MTSVHWHLPPTKTLRDLIGEIKRLKRERELLAAERDLAMGNLGEKLLEIAELKRQLARLRGE